MIQFFLSFSVNFFSLFLIILFLFKISPRNKLQAISQTMSTMSTASFLTFATLLVIMTLSWCHPGEAAPTSDDGNPERAAGYNQRCASRNQNCWRRHRPRTTAIQKGLLDITN